MVGKLAVGVDIGGTKIAFALVDEQGNTLASDRLPTQSSEGVVPTLDRIAEGIARLLQQDKHNIVGIGIGCPGHVDYKSGWVRNAVNLGWTEVALRDEIRQRLSVNLPIEIDKDTNAVALGELFFGAARGFHDFVLIAVGTGLGAACVSNGTVLHGITSNALELGHFSLDPLGRACKCGLRGCPEMYVSGVGLLASLEAHREEYPGSPLTHAVQPTTEAILDAARKRDPLALSIMSEAGQWLGVVMACCAAILNPPLFVIGGGLGHAAADLLIEPAVGEMQKRTVEASHAEVKVSSAQVSANAIGAACLVWQAQAVHS